MFARRRSEFKSLVAGSSHARRLGCYVKNSRNWLAQLQPGTRTKVTKNFNLNSMNLTIKTVVNG